MRWPEPQELYDVMARKTAWPASRSISAIRLTAIASSATRLASCRHQWRVGKKGSFAIRGGKKAGGAALSGNKTRQHKSCTDLLIRPFVMHFFLGSKMGSFPLKPKNIILCDSKRSSFMTEFF